MRPCLLASISFICCRQTSQSGHSSHFLHVGHVAVKGTDVAEDIAGMIAMATLFTRSQSQTQRPVPCNAGVILDGSGSCSDQYVTKSYKGIASCPVCCNTQRRSYCNEVHLCLLAGLGQPYE